jgi:hypothetical protein
MIPNISLFKLDNTLISSIKEMQIENLLHDIMSIALATLGAFSGVYNGMF